MPVPATAHTLAPGSANVAVCVADHIRDPEASLPSVLEHVIRPLAADLLLHVPRSDGGRQLERLARILGAPFESEVAAEDRGRDDFVRELGAHAAAYERWPGATAPLSCEALSANGTAATSSDPYGARCTHVMHLYAGQQACIRLVETAEDRRGRPYAWVVWTRGELRWLSDHPPLAVLEPTRAWVPECASDWGGMYDRHAALPRHLAAAYLSRYDALLNGSLLAPLRESPRRVLNSEGLLLVHARARHMPLGRFPCAAALACCTGCYSASCIEVAPGVRFKSYGQQEGTASWEGRSALRQAACVGRPWRPVAAGACASHDRAQYDDELATYLDGAARVSRCPEDCQAFGPYWGSARHGAPPPPPYVSPLDAVR